VTAPRSAAVSARGVFDVDEHRATEAFWLVWGQAYDIGFTAGTWRASRRGGPGTPITGKTPDELTRAIRADWARRSAR
jgi:hypothetical protein